EEGLPPGDLKKRFSENSSDTKIRTMQQGIRGMLHFLFGSGQPELKDLVTTEDLKEFEKSLPPDRRESLARLPQEMRIGQLRFSYFLSKLPSHMRSERDGFYSSRRGGPSHGDSRRDGPPDSRRGPGGGFRERSQDPPPDGMQPDGPGTQRPPENELRSPGDYRPGRYDMGPPPGPGSARQPG
ncbi:MAG: hypothetical protein ACYC6Y_31965, partial [Thermoguttaceae bacterium]